MTLANRCAARASRGQPCGMRPLLGERFCWAHSPKVASKRTRARRRGGLRRRAGYSAAPVPVQTIGDLQAHLGQVLADVLLLPNSTKRANVVARMLAVGLQLLSGDLEDRVSALESRATDYQTLSDKELLARLETARAMVAGPDRTAAERGGPGQTDTVNGATRHYRSNGKR